MSTGLGLRNIFFFLGGVSNSDRLASMWTSLWSLRKKRKNKKSVMVDVFGWGQTSCSFFVLLFQSDGW